MIFKKISKLLGLCSLLLMLPSACRVEEKLPPLNDKLAGAVDVVTAPSGNYFYVLNSDYERRFNQGSIIIVDPNAPEGRQKIKAVPTPRMGRSMHVAQNLLLVSYADPEARAGGTVEIWDLADETSPQLRASMTVGCIPLNAILAPTMPYFALTCTGGDVYVGKNPKNTAEAPVSLDRVRSYGYDRRALYFHESGGKAWLFGFPTDIDALDYADQTLQDLQSYVVSTDTVVDGANGIPDAFELTASARRRWQLAAPFQMFIYPASDEEAASKLPQPTDSLPFQTFRFVDSGPFTKPTVSNQELHYVNYPLLEADGQASPAEQITDPSSRRYRTNFWDAKRGIGENASIFYVSQRGDYGSESNNVLRFVIDDAQLAISNTVRFEQIFQVNRIYGYRIDRDNSGRYPGDFEIANIGGAPTLLVNSFRDLIYFSGAPFYSITRKLLSGPDVATAVPSSANSSDFRSSYYQLAVSASGKVLTSSFYGNVLYLFDAQPSVSVQDQVPVRIQ